MKLTKKEIAENINATQNPGFNNGFKYDGIVRGFSFETVDHDIHEVDDTGHHTYVCEAKNKNHVVNEIFDWFKSYASQVFDE